MGQGPMAYRIHAFERLWSVEVGHIHTVSVEVYVHHRNSDGNKLLEAMGVITHK